MAKAKKNKKVKRANKYEDKLKIIGTLDQVLLVSKQKEEKKK